MEAKQIDARGLSCPQPVILAKKGIEAMPENSFIEVLVDTGTARENVIRLAATLGCQVAVREDGQHYVLTITRE
ncbi:MAG: sulfurtransferase TusA family protein [bacterium]